MRRGEASVFACFLTITCSLVVIFGFIQLGTWMNWRGDHRAITHKYHQAVAQNEFWLELEGERRITNTPMGQSAAALKPFLKSQTITSSIDSPLVPKTMGDIVVPDGVFDGMWDRTHLCIAGYQPSTTEVAEYCEDAGQFNPTFMQRFQLVLQGKTAQLITHPTPPEHDPFTWFPAHQHNAALVWGSAYVLFASLAFAISALTLRLSYSGYREKDDYGRWPNFTINGKYTDAKWAMYVLVPWWSIPRMILLRVPMGAYRDIHESQEQRRQRLADSRSKAAELIRRTRLRQQMPSIIQDAWSDARADLDKMDAMGSPSEAKAAKEWNKIRADLVELIKELETFPDQLSDRAKVLLARQIARRSAERRDAPKAQLAALDELENE